MKEKSDELTQEKVNKKGLYAKLTSFINSLKEADSILLEWNDNVWRLMVENGLVHRDGSITFKFYNGTEITVK